MAAASRNGVVACSTTTTSARSPAASSSRTAWAMTGFRLGRSAASVGRAQEGHLRAVRARHLGHPRVVGGDHHAVDVGRAAARGVQGVREQRAGRPAA